MDVMNSKGIAEVDHEAVQDLLPWYVNGTLSADEHRQVHRHLEGCAACREELAIERRQGAAVRAEPFAEGAAEPALGRLLAQIATLPAPVRPVRPNLWQRLRESLSIGWMPLVPTLAAAAFVAFVLSFVSTRNATPPADYRVLSNAVAPSTSEADELHVVFAPGLADTQRTAALDAVAGRIVEGPNSAGAYVVRVSHAQTPSDVLVALNQLRGQPGVLLAEPVRPRAVPREAAPVTASPTP